LFITSAASFPDGKAPSEAFSLPETPGVQVVIEPAAGEKCARCWKILPEIGAPDGHAELCHRCTDAVADLVVS
jgi:isoleucyl-tRNA synthetase